MKRLTAIGFATILASTAATPALAHIGLGDHGGFGHGFLHPIGGLDHVLAMVAVGVFAVQLGNRALWLLPLCFMGMMVVGAILGSSGVNLPFVEIGIAASVFVLGALIALDAKLPVALAMAVVGGFAIFHGHAHGTELPLGAAPLKFAVGLVLATGLLHAAGIGLGLSLRWIATVPRTWVIRLAGAAMAVSGGVLATS